MSFRPYDAGKDRDAVQRIWRETGWLRPGLEPSLDLFLEASRCLVADVDGAAESMVTTAPGTMRYLDADLPMSCVTAVTTSRVARKQGFGGRLTAAALAADTAEGAAVSTLGMFEQGFYNRLGFGSGGYEHLVTFDPATLRPAGPAPRVPRRITCDDWAMVHAGRLRRARPHGACNLEPAAITRAEMLRHTGGFGLGYTDGSTLTHHLWCLIPGGQDETRTGPYHVRWLAWQTREQLRELLGLLRNLGDQVFVVRLREPAGVQLQDLLDRPFSQWGFTEQSRYECRVRAVAYWQVRICDLGRCLAQTRLHNGEARFNLRLTDPIEAFLPEDAPWRGISGDYVVTLGAASGAERRHDKALPTLSATINAFSRLWLGVRPASGLAVTDALEAPPELLEQLDHVLRLPDPKPDWEF